MRNLCLGQMSELDPTGMTSKAAILSLFPGLPGAAVAACELWDCHRLAPRSDIYLSLKASTGGPCHSAQWRSAYSPRSSLQIPATLETSD